MNTVAIYRGLELRADGDNLKIRGPKGWSTPETLAELSARKWALLGGLLIERIADAELKAGLRYQFEERAAIAEYDGNLSRIEAERVAFMDLRRAVEGGGL